METTTIPPDGTATAADHSVRALQKALQEIGWPLAADGKLGQQTFNAVHDFQRGFGFWSVLPDGHAGPKTWQALEYCLAHGGRCGPHFFYREWRSHGNGWIKVASELVRGLEEYRDLVGGPVAIVSGYRDPAYNAKVGGAKNSQHMYGNACDLDEALPLARVRALRRFSGIGVQAENGKVRHVDVRHVGPNTTGGTPRDPTVWYYHLGQPPGVAPPPDDI